MFSIYIKSNKEGGHIVPPRIYGSLGGGSARGFVIFRLMRSWYKTDVR